MCQFLLDFSLDFDILALNLKVILDTQRPTKGERYEKDSAFCGVGANYPGYVLWFKERTADGYVYRQAGARSGVVCECELHGEVQSL